MSAGPLRWVRVEQLRWRVQVFGAEESGAARDEAARLIADCFEELGRPAHRCFIVAHELDGDRERGGDGQSRAGTARTQGDGCAPGRPGAQLRALEFVDESVALAEAKPGLPGEPPTIARDAFRRVRKAHRQDRLRGMRGVVDAKAISRVPANGRAELLEGGSGAAIPAPVEARPARGSHPCGSS